MKKIIMVVGNMGSGKTTLAQKIFSEFENSKILSFAHPFKHFLEEEFGLTKEGKSKKELLLFDRILKRYIKEQITISLQNENVSWIKRLWIKFKLHIYLSRFEDDTLVELFTLLYDVIYRDEDMSTYKVKFRKIMQLLGQDVFKSIFKDVWVYDMMTRIKYSNEDTFIIDDCRFEREFKMIRKYARDNRILFLAYRADIISEDEQAARLGYNQYDTIFTGLNHVQKHCSEQEINTIIKKYKLQEFKK